MKKYQILCLLGFLFSFSLLFAQKEDSSSLTCAADVLSSAGNAIEDPLIPQTFAVDSKTQTVVVIDTPENKIVILDRTSTGFKRTNDYLVDVTRKRHDVQFIYKPKSVAIYDNNVVFLASNRDSSYIGVLNMKGDIVKVTRKFPGAATAFSFDKINKRIYIAGLNTSGYNVFDIDVSNGFENISIDSVSSSQSAYEIYNIPRKSEEIAKHDPYGIGLTMIAMGTVFSALIIISIILMGFAKTLGAAQMRRNKTSKDNPQSKKNEPNVPQEDNDDFFAIAAALYLYNGEQHERENRVLTIKRKSSAWNDKRNNMNIYRK
ncbi:MAG: OadG family protein [Bacteroidales bacterium]|nr:OadG family protein [Bacteroidales bacterium]